MLQWLFGGVEALLLLLIITGVCIVAPVYSYLHGGTFFSFEFGLGCWIVGLLIILFGAPLYTVIWGAAIFCSLFFWDINASQSSSNLFTVVVWVYEGAGLLWVATKIVLHAEERRRRRAVLEDEFRRDTVPGAAPTEPPLGDEACQAFVHGYLTGRCEQCAAAYQVLGLEDKADAEDINSAYRDLAKVWHPDRFADDRLKRKADATMKEINAAYGHLRACQAASTGRF